MSEPHGTPRDLESSAMCDVRQELAESYPNITKFMNTFPVSDHIYRHFHTRKRRFKDSLFVFKKKRLSSHDLANNTDIYACGLSGLDLDMSNHNKSRTSCERCRRFKKKCTRDLPECLNCAISEELCHYKPRKKRVSQTSGAMEPESKPATTPVEIGSGMYQIGQGDAYPLDKSAFPRDLEVAIAGKFRGAAKMETRNSDLMRLLN